LTSGPSAATKTGQAAVLMWRRKKWGKFHQGKLEKIKEEHKNWL
jgi:hypothetical protein